MDDDEIEASDKSVIDKCLGELMRHFDTAQVFVTRQEGPDTVAASRGLGNWYARVGQVQEWLDNGGAMHVCEDKDEDE
jgi:hypothetical protein